MAGEEGLVHGDVLDADDALGLEFDDAVDQQKGVAMRQNAPDLVDVKNGHGKGQYNEADSFAGAE